MTHDRARAAVTPPERPRDLAALGFERRPMVRWFSPSILVDAALRVVVSSLFGEYADKREFQAALDPQPGPPLTYTEDDTQDGALWLDYVADLGDGFDSTYAIASLLGRERLTLGGHVLPRGRALLMGGDQVYPDATRQGYEHRFRGPYGAALPWAAEPRPDLLAIPGNHDWYDGLTNFLRFFCAGRDIGAWRTRQRRSYFAVALPHRWWVLGIDIQLDTYIDLPQLTYFRGVGIEPGDRVILVTGKPCWMKARGGHEPDSLKNLRYFEEQVVRAAGAEVRVMLSGDIHHYARYEADDGRQFVTAGGGGAYLAPTHGLPAALHLADGARPRLGARFPELEVSERLARGAWRLPWLAPGLCAVVALMHVLAGAGAYAALDHGGGWWVAAIAPALALLGGLIGHCAISHRLTRILAGGAHALAHVALAWVPALVAVLALGAEGALAALPVAVATAATGFALGGIAFGVYLVLAHRRAGRHANDVFACQSIPDHKNFLRLRLDADGLTIHPVGLRRVPRAWAAAPDDGPGAPFLRPAGEPLDPELIEPPIHVPDDRRAAPADHATTAAEPAGRT